MSPSPTQPTEVNPLSEDEGALVDGVDEGIVVQVDEEFADRVDADDVIAAVHATLEAEGRPGEVTVVITTDEAVAELNEQYRETEGPTDVLSFPAQDPTPGFVSAPEMAGYLGDIIIALPFTERQAAALNRPLSARAAPPGRTRHAPSPGVRPRGARRRGRYVGQARCNPCAPSLRASCTRARASHTASARSATCGWSWASRASSIVAGIAFRITAVEWAVIFVCIGLVLSAELINTVTELAVDLLTQRYHPMAKLAKDAGAGAVLVTALASVAVGIAIFGPRLWRLMFGG